MASFFNFIIERHCQRQYHSPLEGILAAGAVQNDLPPLRVRALQQNTSCGV
jgi:hypothetical protein